MKKAVLAVAIILMSFNFSSCTPQSVTDDQEVTAIKGEHETSEEDPNDDD